jgi:osmotically-inducible protein OsmY
METIMNARRALAVSLAASLALAANAMAATRAPVDAARLSSQYSDWAGGKTNADAIVSGMRTGSSVTIVTSGRDRNVSIAGFTPSARMSEASIAGSLANAQRSLARLGITQPNAEQIQAALIGGEILLPNGSSAVLRGTVAARGAPTEVAVR